VESTSIPEPLTIRFGSNLNCMRKIKFVSNKVPNNNQNPKRRPTWRLKTLIGYISAIH